MVFKNENSINNSNFVNSNIIQINVDGKNLNIDDNLIKNLFTYSKNSDLFFRLLNEKIEIGKNQLLLLNLSKLLLPNFSKLLLYIFHKKREK